MSPRCALVALMGFLLLVDGIYAAKSNVVKSSLSCGERNRSRKGLVILCTIDVIGADGNPADAATSDFQIESRLSATVQWLNGPTEQTNKLQFAYISPESNHRLQDRLQVTAKATGTKWVNIKGSPLAMNLYGVPSELSTLDCDAEVVFAGETVNCNVTLYDSDNVATSGFGADFDTLSADGTKLIMSARDVTERKDYSFAYTPTGSVFADSVQASLRMNGVQIQGAPRWLIVYQPPSARSTLECDQSRVAAGESTVCTITIRDAQGNPTVAFPSDVAIASESGVPVLLYNDGQRRGEISFVYSPTKNVKRDSLRVSIRGEEIASSAVLYADAPPSDLSQLSCGASALRPGRKMACTLTILDRNGQPTFAKASDLLVSDRSGQALALTPSDDGRYGSFTFEYTAPPPSGDQFEQISVKINAGEQPDVQNSPWKVRLTRDRITSTQNNNMMVATEQLESPNGKFRFVVQEDGNLVIWRASDSTAIWASNTWRLDWADPSSSHDFHLLLSSTANLALFDQGSPIWSTNSATAGTKGSVLIMQNDGELVLYEAGTSRRYWSSGSKQKAARSLTLSANDGQHDEDLDADGALASSQPTFQHVEKNQVDGADDLAAEFAALTGKAL